LAILAIVVINQGLASFGSSALAGVTTVYVSLRLGYTAKAGIENYKKISETYKEIQDAAAISDNNEEDNSEDYDNELG